MKKLVIASDSFKGTLSSREIASLFEEQLKATSLDTKLEKVVLGDGGENTLEVFSSNFPNGKYYQLEVTGPNFKKVTAKYYTYDKYAVIELAEAAGLTLSNPKNPMVTTTYGVGELILDAYNKGYRHFYVSLGGSSTTDGGCGLLSALGIKFYNQENEPFIPVGGTLSIIKTIDETGLKVKDARFTILSDVSNPMFGPKGAAYTFAKQKGANEEEIEVLDRNLRYLSELFIKHTGKHIEDVPGSGAAGATSAGMLAYLNSEIVSGIETILNIINFDDIIEGADYVITGEGKLDSQSFDGKLISGVLKHTNSKHIPTICVCGTIENNLQNKGFYKIYTTSDSNCDFEYIKKNAPSMYSQTVRKLLLDILK